MSLLSVFETFALICSFNGFPIETISFHKLERILVLTLPIDFKQNPQDAIVVHRLYYLTLYMAFTHKGFPQSSSTD